MKKVLIIFFAMVLLGCASGNKKITDDNLVSTIVEGKTTKQEIYDMFDLPDMEGTAMDGRKYASYGYAKTIKTEMMSSVVQRYTLTLFFDDNNVVTEIKKGESKTRVR